MVIQDEFAIWGNDKRIMITINENSLLYIVRKLIGCSFQICKLSKIHFFTEILTLYSSLIACSNTVSNKILNI